MESLFKWDIVPIQESIQLLDISDEEYFSDKYKDYISNSKLKLINPDEGGSPELWLQGIPSSYSDSFYFGSAIHCSILQPNDFIVVNTVDRPTAKAGFMADELYPSYLKCGGIVYNEVIKASDKISYYKGKMDTDKFNVLKDKLFPYFEQRYAYENRTKDKRIPIYLDPRSRYKFEECIRSVSKNIEIQKLLHPEGLINNPTTYNEATVLLDVNCLPPCKEESLRLKLKGKLDHFSVDYETGIITLNDLKTTSHPIDVFKKESFFKYHYARQLALYGWMLKQLNNTVFHIEKPIFKCNILVVSTIPPYDSGVMNVSNNTIQKGIKELSKLLNLVAHVTAGNINICRNEVTLF